MRIDVYHHFDGVLANTDHKLNQIYIMLKSLVQREMIMVQEIQDLVAEVSEVKTVQASATVAIAALIDRFNVAIQAATDLEEAKAAAVQMKAELAEATAPLSAAIANVPA